jgi:hypothetical protein
VSAWGKSWGLAFGVAWGLVSAPVVPEVQARQPSAAVSFEDPGVAVKYEKVLTKLNLTYFGTIKVVTQQKGKVKKTYQSIPTNVLTGVKINVKAAATLKPTLQFSASTFVPAPKIKGVQGLSDEELIMLMLDALDIV